MMPTAAWSCVNVLSFRAAQSHIGYRGDYLSWRGLEGGRPIGVNLRRGGAANSSPPPCGEGLGVGVVRGGTALPQPPDPPPRPSPSRNRVYAGFGHSTKRSKSATADFDWGEGVAVARLSPVILASIAFALACLTTAAYAAGDAAKGKAAFERQCLICHTNEKDGENRFGPNLFGIIGKKAGSVPGYAYTNAFKTRANWEWTEDAIGGWM